MSRRRLPAHVCPICNARYRPQDRDQVFCSVRCRDIGKRKSFTDDVNLHEEIEAAKAERATAPLYRYWHRHLL